MDALARAVDQITELESQLVARDKELEEVRAKLEKMVVLRFIFYNGNDAFEWSEQPCQDFKPQRENNGYGEWDNRHECPGCCGLRSFCINCSVDHHENGWDNCAGRVKAQVAALREELERAQIHNGELVADLMGCRDGALVRDLKARNARLEGALEGLHVLLRVLADYILQHGDLDNNATGLSAIVLRNRANNIEQALAGENEEG